MLNDICTIWLTTISVHRRQHNYLGKDQVAVNCRPVTGCNYWSPGIKVKLVIHVWGSVSVCSAQSQTQLRTQQKLQLFAFISVISLLPSLLFLKKSHEGFASGLGKFSVQVEIFSTLADMSLRQFMSPQAKSCLIMSFRWLSKNCATSKIHFAFCLNTHEGYCGEEGGYRST